MYMDQHVVTIYDLDVQHVAITVCESVILDI